MGMETHVQLDRADARPLYRQLIDGLTAFCREQPAGTKLPTERELCVKLGCSRNILRQALEHMVEQGYLERRRANGTFVAPRSRGRKLLVVQPDANDITQAWQYIMPGIETRAMELEIELVKISLSFLRSGNLEEKQRFLHEQKLSGAILLAALYLGDEPEIQLFRQAEIPAVLPMGRDVDTLMTPFFVMTDVVRPAFLAAICHLVRLGHSRIAAIGVASDGDGIRGFTRHEFAQYLRCPENELLLYHPEWSDAGIDETIRTILALPQIPSALICYSDFIAIKVLESLKRHGRRVPEDISVMGFCGYPGGAFLTPALTTVSLCYEQRGRAAVDFFADNDLRVEALPQIGFELVERASVRPRPHSPRKSKP